MTKKELIKLLEQAPGNAALVQVEQMEGEPKLQFIWENMGYCCWQDLRPIRIPLNNMGTHDYYNKYYKDKCLK